MKMNTRPAARTLQIALQSPDLGVSKKAIKRRLNGSMSECTIAS